MLSCLIFEDADLLVVNKPAGLNTHSPSPYAGEGMYEWLKHRERQWSRLAILHRLDKETSGLIVFGKTTVANRALTQQFTAHTIRKKYLLVTDRPVSFEKLTVVSSLIRTREKYASREVSAPGEKAETRFTVLERHPGKTILLAEPITGRTHQIRSQAAGQGFPILGDTLYGGTPAPRVYLHAAELELRHPASDETLKFHAPVDFNADSRLALRHAVIDAEETDAWRLIHGGADGWPGWYVEKLGEYLLSQSAGPLTPLQKEELNRWQKCFASRAAYHKILDRQVRRNAGPQTSPQCVMGEKSTGPFMIRENGLKFELSFDEGYSVGLFLDQRENRRRWLAGYVGADFSAVEWAGPEVLNTFAYTCGFSLCAARAGARTTSLDLSRKYLDWGRRNFALNGLDTAQHDFIYGDTFDWLKRLDKKSRKFDAVLLDPPTFSQSRAGGVFSAEKDYGRLVAAALPLIKSGGVLFASTNAARLEPEQFLATIGAQIQAQGRKIRHQHYVPQPPDFPINRAEPAYLKTAWFCVD